MTSQLPIACSLSAAELLKRMAEMRAIGLSSFLDAKVRANRATLRFTDDAGTAERLAAVVAGEAECCAFLDMSVRDTGEGLELEIIAPEGAEPLLADFIDAFSGQPGLAA